MRARACARAGKKGIIVGCRCVLVPGRLERRICRTMALCSSTHLSQRGEVRGPDRWEITKEQTSLNPRGATEGWKEIRIWHRDGGGGVKNVEKEGCRFGPHSEVKAKWKLT